MSNTAAAAETVPAAAKEAVLATTIAVLAATEAEKLQQP